MQTRPRYPYTLGAAVLWMVFVLLVYYWIHKPLPTGDFWGETKFGAPTAAIFTNLGGALLDTLVVLVMVVVSAGVGRRVMITALGAAAVRPYGLALEALLGLGLLGNLILAVGLVWLHAISIGALLVVLAVLTRHAMLGWLRDLGIYLSNVRGIDNRWDRWLLIFIGFNLVLAFIMALAPPIKFDALTYHLVGPQHWLREGRFASLEGSHFFGFPQLVNTLFAGHMALTFGRLTGAAILHWAIGALALMAVGNYGARRFSMRVGLLAVTVLLTATSIWMQFTWSYVDLAALGFGFAAYVALENWRLKQDALGLRWLILAAVFVGLAMSVKYPLVALGVAAGVYILVFSQRQHIIRNGLILVGVATFALAPWLLRNFFFYDNPVYPYGPATAEWDELMREWYTNSEGALLNELPGLWITAPLSSTFIGIDGAGGFAATIGPLYLLLIPMLLITWGGLNEAWRRHLRSMLPFIGVFGAVWMVASALTTYGAQTRLWYAMFPLLALWAAVGLDSLRLLPKKPLDLYFVVSAMVGVVLVFTAFDHVRGTRSDEGTLEGTTLVSHFLESGAHNYFLGTWDEDKYLDANLGWHIVTMRHLNDLPEDSQVLFLWETRSLYCDETRITCLEDWVLLRWWHARRTVGDGTAEAIIEHWRQQGVTHVLVRLEGRDFEFDNNNFLTEEDEAEWMRVPDLLQEIEWDGSDTYTLYTIPD